MLGLTWDVAGALIESLRIQLTPGENGEYIATHPSVGNIRGASPLEAIENLLLKMGVEPPKTSLVVRLGEEYNLSVCCSSGQWFVWDETRQTHLSDKLHDSYREAVMEAASAVGIQ